MGTKSENGYFTPAVSVLGVLGGFWRWRVYAGLGFADSTPSRVDVTARGFPRL